MKYFLLTNVLLAANWLQQGVASGEGSEKKRLDETTDRVDKEDGKSLYQVLYSPFASLRGAFQEDTVSEFGVEKGGYFTSGYYFKGREKITWSAQSSPDGLVSKPPTDYILKFGIEPKGTISGYSSIIHFTTSGDCCAYGQRVPGIFFLPDSTRLHVSTEQPSNDKQYQNLKEQLPLDQKSMIEVRVVGSVATVMVNGVITSTKSVGSRPQIDQVKVYIGDPWLPAANAFISDVIFTSASADVFQSMYYFPGNEKITRSAESSPVALVLKPPTDYILKFEIEPQGTISGFSSIIHFTTSGDCCAYGQRVPGIFFHSDSTRLRVTTGQAGHGDQYQDLLYSLPLDQKSKIEVRVVGSLATVKVNGVIKSSKSVRSRPQIDQVKVYIGDPYYPAADAFISNIAFFKA